MSVLPDRLADGARKGGQLREILAGLIATLEPGAAMPSERMLAERYAVARGTVRSEIDRLAAEGAVERVQGRGTFVAPPRVAQAQTLSSFSEDMRARGHQPGSTVLRHEVVPAGEDVARRLGLQAGEPVLRVQRLRTADGRPMALEEAFLPAGRFPGLEADALAAGSLFERLEREGVRLHGARQRVVAVVVVGAQARLLGVEPGTPGLRFDTDVVDEALAPVTTATTLYRGDRYAIEIDQRR